MDNNPIVLLHVSDIHFRSKRISSSYDLDKDLRNELVRDAQTIKDQLGEITGIVVTGDIAFAGDSKEYESAKIWLRELSERLNCPEENIWVVPGNHDVDRSVIENSPMICSAHEKIRKSKDNDLTKNLEDYLEATAEDAYLLFAPLKHYQEFASLFSCPTTPATAHWTSDIILNDSSKLRLVGLNSVIISNADDDVIDNRLIINQGQLDFQTEDGVEYISLCHHPIEWLRDRESIKSKLNSRVRVQLFGHTHKLAIEECGDKSISVVAGATHPDRGELDWQPRFNIISFLVQKKPDTSRCLSVRVFPRIWQNNEKFEPDLNSCNNGGKDYKEFCFELSAWSPKEPTHQPTESPATPSPDLEVHIVNPEKQLIHRFLTLPYPSQMKLAMSLDLLDQEDASLKKYEWFSRILGQAKSENKLESLWNKIAEELDLSETDKNPYKDM